MSQILAWQAVRVGATTTPDRHTASEEQQQSSSRTARTEHLQAAARAELQPPPTPKHRKFQAGRDTLPIHSLRAPPPPSRTWCTRSSSAADGPEAAWPLVCPARPCPRGTTRWRVRNAAVEWTAKSTWRVRSAASPRTPPPPPPATSPPAPPIRALAARGSRITRQAGSCGASIVATDIQTSG